MPQDETKELNALLNSGAKKDSKDINSPRSHYHDDDDESDFLDEDDFSKAYTQWTSHDGKTFLPANKTRQKLIPGVYEVKNNPNLGLYFQKIPTRTEGLLRFPDTNSDKVIDEITKFWASEEVFKAYGLPYKRGILLWGPPGSGKSCTIQFVMADVVKRGGVVVRFNEPYIFIEGMRILRTIQPDIPVVVILEDIDSIIEEFHESEVLNILDGVNQAEKVVFLATTNHPEKLGARIVNRPSRFDKRFKIGFPSQQARKLYLEHVIGNGDVKAGRAKIKELNINLKSWVKDTDQMSVAHLKELFVAVVIMGDTYDDAIQTLKTMREDVEKTDPEYEDFGFHKVKKKSEKDELDWDVEAEDSEE